MKKINKKFTFIICYIVVVLRIVGRRSHKTRFGFFVCALSTTNTRNTYINMENAFISFPLQKLFVRESRKYSKVNFFIPSYIQMYARIAHKYVHTLPTYFLHKKIQFRYLKWYILHFLYALRLKCLTCAALVFHSVACGYSNSMHNKKKIEELRNIRVLVNCLLHAHKFEMITFNVKWFGYIVSHFNFNST